MNTTTFGRFFTAVIASVAASASADFYVFDNPTSYAAFCSDVGISDRRAQDLSAFSGSYPSLTGGSGSYAWTMSATGGVFLDGQGSAQTINAADELCITFSSAGVRGVAGYFQSKDGLGNFVNTSMSVTLANGFTFRTTISPTPRFRGLVSYDDDILRVSFSPAISGSSQSSYFASTSGFEIGAVPSPAVSAVLVGIGWIARRRRG